MNLFLFSSKQESPYEKMYFFIIIRHRLKIIATRFYATHKINPLVVEMMHLQFPGYKNIMDLCNLESDV